MARRRGRLVLAILGGVCGVLVLAVLLLPFLVPREHLRSLAEQQVRSATGGDASLGPVSLRVLPRLRLVLGPSSVHMTAAGLRGAGQDPGPLSAVDAELSRLEVDLALWPLLRRQLEFGEVRVDAPRLRLVTLSPEAAAAAADTLGRPAAPIMPLDGATPPVPPPAAMDFGLALTAVEVRDGEIHWQEEDTGREVHARGWNQDMTAPQLGVLMQRVLRLQGADLPIDPVPGPVSLDLDARVAALELRGFGETPLPPLANLRLLGAYSLPPAADQAEFTVRELSLTGWQATAAGHFTAERVAVTELDLAGGQAVSLRGSLALALPPHRGPLVCELDGTVDLGSILAQVQPWLPPLPPDAPPLPALTGTLQIGLSVALTDPPGFDEPKAWEAAWRQGLAGQAALSARGGPLSVATPQLGEPLRIAAVSLAGDLRAATGKTRLDLTGLAHPALQGDAVVEVVPAAGKDQAVSARLELPRLDLDALAALVEAMQATQTARAGGVGAAPHASRRFSLVGVAWAAASGTAAAAPAPGELIPPDLAVDLTASVREIVFLKTSYTNAEVRGTLRERVIDVAELKARLATGSLGGKATLDYAADPRGLASWDVRVQDAPAAALLAPYLPLLAGLWTGTLSAQAAGSCSLADPQALLNSLRLAGDLQGSNGIIDLREQLKDVGPYLGQRQDLLRVQYSQVRQPFQITDGKIVADGLRIDGRDTDWRGGGWLGLDGTLNLDLNVRLPAGFTPNLGDLTFLADGLRDKDGRIVLDFSLTGDARRPAVALNLDPAALLKSDALKNKLKDEGQEQLQKLQDEVKKGAGSLLDRIRRGR